MTDQQIIEMWRAIERLSEQGVSIKFSNKQPCLRRWWVYLIDYRELEGEAGFADVVTSSHDAHKAVMAAAKLIDPPISLERKT